MSDINIFTSEELGLLKAVLASLDYTKAPNAARALLTGLEHNEVSRYQAARISWSSVCKEKATLLVTVDAADRSGDTSLSEQLMVLVRSLDMIQDHVEKFTWVNPYPIFWCEDCDNWSDSHDITCRGAHVNMKYDGEMPFLEECLEQVCVEWDPQPSWPKGAEFAISSNAGIIAYYADRAQAFYDRLDLINSILNNPDWKYPFTEWNLRNTIN